MKATSPAEGCIYLCFLFRSGGFCCKKILRLCRHYCYKIRPPYCHPKVSICCNIPIPRRCRSQPLSGVSRKQRYNTLDFASKIVCQQGCCSPLLESQSQGDTPLCIPLVSVTCIYTSLPRLVYFTSSENSKIPQFSLSVRDEICGIFVE